METMNQQAATSSSGNRNRHTLAELRRRQLEAAMAGDIARSAEFAREARQVQFCDDETGSPTDGSDAFQRCDG